MPRFAISAGLGTISHPTCASASSASSCSPRRRTRFQGLLVWLWKPSKHPLMEMFKGTPNPSFFVLLFVSAAIVAPLFEELMFRVVLQGFLEKAIVIWDDLNALLIGGSSSSVKFSGGITDGIPAEGISAAIDSNPYASPSLLSEQSQTAAPQAPINNQPELAARRPGCPSPSAPPSSPSSTTPTAPTGFRSCS